MRKILIVALLLICITARKHPKGDGQEPHGPKPGHGPKPDQGPQAADPMAQCFEQNCQDQALACFFDDQCMKTFETCNQTFGDAITPEDLQTCTAEDQIAQQVIQCIADKCSAVQTLMSYFSRRQH